MAYWYWFKVSAVYRKFSVLFKNKDSLLTDVKWKVAYSHRLQLKNQCENLVEQHKLKGLYSPVSFISSTQKIITLCNRLIWKIPQKSAWESILCTWIQCFFYLLILTRRIFEVAIVFPCVCTTKAMFAQFAIIQTPRINKIMSVLVLLCFRQSFLFWNSTLVFTCLTVTLKQWPKLQVKCSKTWRLKSNGTSLFLFICTEEPLESKIL